MSDAPKLRAIDYQRRPIRLLNGMLRGANRVGLARVSLDTQTLLDDARRQTGLDDFGDDRFLEPLEVLVRSTRDAALNPIGRLLAKTNIARLLRGRLQAQELWRRHPEILERDMPDPVVIVGLARSGTTRLHRLLAADERFAHLKSWESVYPVPGPESFAARESGATDPRITALDKALKGVLYLSPQVAAVHPLGTMEVEEEIGLLQYAFATQLFEVINDLPEFAEWLMTHDQTHAYEHMVKLLKTVSWFRGDPQDKPWVLKSPQHMQDLDALLNVFPRARLVCPHRDPIKVVGSSCSMAWNSLVRDNDAVTPERVGREWLAKTERMLRKNLRDRETLCSPERQHDVLYADITADWEASMRGVYDFLDMPFEPRAREAMGAWIKSNSQHKHGAHKYTLEQFGLSAGQVDERLMFYRERFAIPYETSNPHTAHSAGPTSPEST
ncbi:MAG: sulfotransferase [Halioglobus sp.]|nr:sulfotransferase [Halioglobus sp.]